MANSPPILLTRSQMIERLLDTKGAKGVAWVAVTDPAWVKFGRGMKDDKGGKVPNPFIGKVVKVAQIAGQINFIYENGVINSNMREIKAQREAAGEPALTDAELREAAIARYDRGDSWQMPYKVDGRMTPFCINKKDAEKVAAEGLQCGVPIYLWVRCLKAVDVRFFNRETGEEMTRSALEPYMTEKNEDAGANQGIEDKEKRVVPLAYGFGGLAVMKMDGNLLYAKSWHDESNAALRQTIETIAGMLVVPD